MGILLMLKEGGSLILDSTGGSPIDEDIDLIPDVVVPVGMGVMALGEGTMGI
tara:strand:- start:822 stop:977 length:156 start_codon:yes stop_codon:yes gene_type:complete